MEIRRDIYLKRLIKSKDNGSVKIITGIRRAGKSYLLFEIYYRWLLTQKIPSTHIIKIKLDEDTSESLRSVQALRTYIDSKTTDPNAKYYIFIDEIQMVDGFESLVNALNNNKNFDVYISGSNSKFLSSDIATEFRGRGFIIQVHPLSLSEIMLSFPIDFEQAWREYYVFGGLPQVVLAPDEESKAFVLQTLLDTIYIRDIIERNNLDKNDDNIGKVLDVVASSVGSITSSSKLAQTFASLGVKGVSDKTIKKYLNFFESSYLLERVDRYNIKGKQYLETRSKYYFEDVGVRNARLNFRQTEENHIMENIIYNELRRRGYNVDVGIVEKNVVENGKNVRKQLEVDFVCNQASKRYYIQSAFAIPDYEKMEQEQRSLVNIDDSFKKIIIVRQNTLPWQNEQGVTILNIKDFLLDLNSLER